jgi:hypothetical protein
MSECDKRHNVHRRFGNAVLRNVALQTRKAVA